MKKILIADDHHVVTFAVSMMLKNHFQNVFIDFSENYEDVKSKIRQERFDLIMLDIEMPGSTYTGMIKELKALQEDLLIMIFSAHEDDMALPYIKEGADGYLNKKCSHEKVIRAVECMLLDGYYYPFKVINDAIHAMDDKSAVHTLSEREFQIFELLSQGEGLIEISNLLNLNHSTVSTYKKRIYNKLEVKNLIELSKIYNDIK